MEKEQYDLMFAQEERHWWYVGMRRISRALLDRYPPLTERLADRVLSLPMYPELPIDHVERVAEIVSRIAAHR